MKRVIDDNYQRLFGEFLSNIDITEQPEYMIEELIEIEKLISEEELDDALMDWNSMFQQFDHFPQDVVRQKIAYFQGDYSLCMKIQIHWQVILDKFEQTPITRVYLGYFYLFLGIMYLRLDEYEVSANLLGKADSIFNKLQFPYTQFVIQEAIAKSYIDLGALGDARYHLRESLRREYEPSPEELCYNKILQGDLYLREDQTKKAAKEYLEARKLQDEISDELKEKLLKRMKQLNKQRNS